MKKIKLYEEFVGEAYKFYDLFFNSHVDHNPECDILEGHLDKDSLITYGIYIKGPKEGLEFMEYYSGSNYKSTSDKRSNSKLFMVDKIPAKYKAMWEDLKKIYENEYAGSGRVSTRNEALVVEGQFSWMAQDTGRQIGSERENTITVYMFDDKGQKWEEKKYDGYGEFGGKDYYELLAQMNGVENADRQDGIDIAFGKTKTKGKTLFPALVEDPRRFNFKKHDFTVQPDNDPNQSWYQEEEYDDDDNYDDSDESLNIDEKEVNLFDEVGPVNEATSYDPDDIFFLWDDCVDNGREGIERGHTGSGSSKHELFTFDTEVDGYDKFETELKKLLKKSGWKNEYNQDTLKVYESTITESAMSDIDLLAQEAKDFKSFVKEFKKEYKNMDAGSAKELEAWLQSVYDAAKTNESVVTEGKHWHVLSGNTWYTGSDFSTNPADAMKYDDIMSATKVAKKVGGMVHVMTDEEMTKAIKKFGKNESVVTEAKDVKSEVIDKLSQFFGVSTGALIKFNFDGKDDVRALTKALNGTDYEGVDNIVRVAVKAAKRDLGVDEAIKPAGLSKAETKKVAETYAKAIGKNDGVKCTVNLKSLEEDSFDLDIDGEEYAGGSYMITLDGDVINAALPEKPVYGQIDSTVDQIIKNLKLWTKWSQKI